MSLKSSICLLLLLPLSCFAMPQGQLSPELSVDFRSGGIALASDFGDSSADTAGIIPPAAPDVPAASNIYGAAADSAATASSTRKPFYMSLKTNMLFDLLLLPNVGAEFHFGKNWSATAGLTYGWWDRDSRHRYWRAYGGEIAVRRWFGKASEIKPLTGHHVGLYASLFTYDFEFGGKGQMAGEPGEPLWSNPSYAFGVEYGYSLPVSSRLNLDFTVGIGYFGGKYHEYEPVDNHYVWQATKQRRWFGPTKVEVSLVWLLGHGNRNVRKGGAE